MVQESQEVPGADLGLVQSCASLCSGETKGSFPEKAIEEEPLIPSEKKAPVRVMCFLSIPRRH